MPLKDGLRVPRDWRLPAVRPLCDEFDKATDTLEVSGVVRAELTQILGPLTLRERWDVLENYGLDQVREDVALEGAASIVAHGVTRMSLDLGYPINALLLQMVRDQRNLSQLDPKILEMLDFLLVENNQPK